MGPGGGHSLEQDGVKRFAFLVHHAEQEIGYEQAGDGDGQGDGHVAHGAFAGLDAGLAQDWQAVADGLDSGVGARPHAVGPQDQQRHAQQTELGMGGAHFPARLSAERSEVR